MLQEIQAIANKVKLEVGLSRKVNREQVLVEALRKEGYKVKVVGDKHHKGQAFFAIEMKNVVRVNYRCGHGKYNYAPCVEVIK